MDRLRTFEVFRCVAEAGSFVGAARALRMPPATVTTAVQALEARLGVKLLHRTTRRVSLTPDGAAYLDEAGRLVRELEELDARVGDATRAVSGRLRVDVPAAAGRQVIAPALPSLLARHPELQVLLGSSDRPVDLLAEGVDCVIRGGDLHDETLIARKLAELPVITCASPAYLRRRGTPRSPRALDGHEFVGFFSARTGRVFDVDFADGGEVIELPPRHRVAVNDADTWLAAALAGLGLVQAPLSNAVREHLEAGRLRRVLAEYPSEPLALYVSYPRTRHLQARVRAFVDWVVELYRGEGARAARFLRRG